MKKGKRYNRIPRGRKSVSNTARFSVKNPHTITTIGMRGGVRK